MKLSSLCRCTFAFFFLCIIAVGSSSAQEIYDSQKESIPRQDPQQVVAEAELPAGFHIQVAAHEPQIQQPIAMAWDFRGRLWVAENYTYAESSKKFDMTMSDRIVILEDTDSDGVFDKRKVFIDGLKELTSIEFATGGIWALASPNLYFIPDADNDDRPDTAPQVQLSGFNPNIRHNFANGLRMGPDGWLYGRHGILGASDVKIELTPEVHSSNVRRNLQGQIPGSPLFSGTGGKPQILGVAGFDPVKLTCGIWRYHPKEFRLEMVCEGTTNPWGMDWDAHGNLFFINTVIGHLWHSIPNAHLQRMYGEDSDSTSYELLPQIADHVHWDEKGEDWKATRTGAPSHGTDVAGGGHAHSGMMIYQGGQWPEQYRDRLFTLNLHGLRINADRLERAGAGFIGKHEPDVVKWHDPWFRGIELGSGPDGSVFVLDWSDIGECHDDDGVHRSSGRIYRVSYSKPSDAVVTSAPKLSFSDLEASALKSGFASLSKEQYVELLHHPNSWYVNQLIKAIHVGRAPQIASPQLLELAMKPVKVAKSSETAKPNHQQANRDQQLDPVVVQMRALWVLDAMNQLSEKRINELLRTEQHEAIYCWAVRRFADRASTLDDAKRSEGEAEIHDRLTALTDKKPAHLMKLYTAAVLPKMSGYFWKIANDLASSQDLAQDRYFPLVLWYGIKDQIKDDPMRAAKLVTNTKIPKLNELITRRLADLQKDAPEALSWIAADVARNKKPEDQANFVNGLWLAHQGRRSATAPGNWEKIAKDLLAHPDGAIRDKVVMLQVLFGDGVAVEKLIELATDSKLPATSRKSAIESLSSVNKEAARSTLWSLVSDQVLGGAAAQALGRNITTDEAKRMVDLYPGVWPPGKVGIISALGNKKESLAVLLDAIEAKKLPVEAVDATTWRQFTFASDWDILSRARKLNPSLAVQGDQEKRIQAVEDWLSDKILQEADVGRGSFAFQKACASCHKLFGDGGLIGPELTGAQRTNKRYWIENIVAPSAAVATSFQIELFSTVDGGVISGVPVSENDTEVVIQSAKEKIVLEKVEISERRKSTLSLMPEGLLDTMSAQTRADLFKYLMSPVQVPPKSE